MRYDFSDIQENVKVLQCHNSLPDTTEDIFEHSPFPSGWGGRGGIMTYMNASAFFQTIFCREGRTNSKYMCKFLPKSFLGPTAAAFWQHLINLHVYIQTYTHSLNTRYQDN